MKLWVDDLFAPPDETWMWAKSSREALNLLHKHPEIHEIALDHDLGGDDTGMPIAHYIEEGAYYGTVPRIRWQIISNSPVGYFNLLLSLRQADFYWKEKEACNGGNGLQKNHS